MNPGDPPALNAGDILFFGHTHLPLALKRGTIYVLNPGSISLPEENPPSYGPFDGSTLQIKTFAGDVLYETAAARRFGCAHKIRATRRALQTGGKIHRR